VAHGADRANVLHKAGICWNMGHANELGVVAANQIRHGLHVDAAFDLVWCSQNLHPQSCLEGEKLDLVGYVIVASRQDDIISFERNRRQRPMRLSSVM
jgi:hypothetical protein